MELVCVLLIFIAIIFGILSLLFILECVTSDGYEKPWKHCILSIIIFISSIASVIKVNNIMAENIITNSTKCTCSCDTCGATKTSLSPVPYTYMLNQMILQQAMMNITQQQNK